MNITARHHRRPAAPGEPKPPRSLSALRLGKASIPGAWRLALGALLLPLAAAAQQPAIGTVLGFTKPDYFPPPNQNQVKSLVTGAEAQMQSGGVVLLKGLHIETFRATGEREIVAQAADCAYESTKNEGGSPGLLEIEAAGGKFSIRGTGFHWDQAGPGLTISNDVRTIIRRELLEQVAGGRPSLPATSTNAQDIEILAHFFHYDGRTNLAIYRDNVRVSGPKLRLNCDVLTARIPREGSRLDNINAEGDVLMDYAGLSARSGRAVYVVTNDTLLLSEKPTWQTQGREGRCDLLLLEPSNRVVQATGHAWLKMPRGSNTAGLFPEPADSQPRPAGGAPGFVEVFSDGYLLQTNRAVFNGNVRAVQTQEGQITGSMNCGELTLEFTGTNQLDRMVAERAVSVAQGDRGFTGERAAYSAANRLLSFTGKPRWRAGGNEGGGGRLVLDQPQERLLAIGDAFMILQGEGLGGTTPGGTGPKPAPPGAAKRSLEIRAAAYELSRQDAVFRGGVSIQDATTRLTCATLNATFTEDGQALAGIIGEGNVVIDLVDEKGQTVRGTGERLVHSRTVTGGTTNSVIELSGEPALEMNQGTLTAPTIVWDLVTGQLKAATGYKLKVRPDVLKTNAPTLLNQ